MHPRSLEVVSSERWPALQGLEPHPLPRPHCGERRSFLFIYLFGFPGLWHTGSSIFTVLCGI